MTVFINLDIFGPKSQTNQTRDCVQVIEFVTHSNKLASLTDCDGTTLFLTPERILGVPAKVGPCFSAKILEKNLYRLLNVYFSQSTTESTSYFATRTARLESSAANTFFLPTRVANKSDKWKQANHSKLT